MIDGIQDNSNVISYLYGARTVELVVRMDRYEYQRMQVRPTINTTGQKITAINENAANKPPDAEVRCYNYSQFGHYQSQCQKPKHPPNSCFIYAKKLDSFTKTVKKRPYLEPRVKLEKKGFRCI